MQCGLHLTSDIITTRRSHSVYSILSFQVTENTHFFNPSFIPLSFTTTPVASGLHL